MTVRTNASGSGECDVSRRVVCSVQTRLLHDAKEFRFVDFAVAVAVGLVDHFLRENGEKIINTAVTDVTEKLLIWSLMSRDDTHLQLFVGQVFTQLLRDALQVLERDFARLVVVEESERTYRISSITS